MRGVSAKSDTDAFVGFLVKAVDISRLKEGDVLSPIDLVRLLGVGTHDKLFRPRVLELRARLEKERNLVSCFRRGRLTLLSATERTDYGMHQAHLGVKRLGRNASRLQTTVTDGMDEDNKRKHESATSSVGLAHEAARRAIRRQSKTASLAVPLSKD